MRKKTAYHAARRDKINEKNSEEMIREVGKIDE